MLIFVEIWDAGRKDVGAGRICLASFSLLLGFWPVSDFVWADFFVY